METKVYFRCEPFIMHICCRTIEDAQKIVNVARSVGFKRTGIQSTKNKIIVEVNSSEVFETIIIRGKKLLVNDDYTKELVDEANIKLKSNLEKVKKFYWHIKYISD